MLDVSMDRGEQVDEEVEVSDLRGEQIAESFSKDIEQVIRATWGDKKALRGMASKLAAKSHHEIWSKFPENKEIVL